MKKIYVLGIAASLMFQFSCKKKADPAPVDSTAATQKLIIENYSNIVYATYDDSWLALKNLKTAASAFTSTPSEGGLKAVREAYIAARTPYIQSEAFRFYAGPIDDDRGLEGLINSWPLDESYIDYIENDANTGLVNDVAGFPTITKELIADNNQTAGEESVSCGFHAVEFLLWGQDLSVDGPGNRPYTDYVTGGAGTNKNQERRAAYLLACIDLLIDNLNTLRQDWSSSVANNYRAKFVASPSGSIANFLTGAFRYADGELSVERMQVALDAEEDAERQENEQSCFSDQTHMDIILGQKGIRNVYVGEYTRTDGSTVKGMSLSILVTSKNPLTGANALAKISNATAKVAAIHPPFDNEIVLSNPAGRTRVQDAINALHEEAAQYQAAGAALGLIIN